MSYVDHLQDDVLTIDVAGLEASLAAALAAAAGISSIVDSVLGTSPMQRLIDASPTGRTRFHVQAEHAVMAIRHLHAARFESEG